jgi:hypothetical protein
MFLDPVLKYGMSFAETRNDNGRSKEMKLFLNIMLLLSCILTVVVPYVIPLIFWLHPCEPQFLGSMLLTCSTDGSWTWAFLILKTAFLVLEIIASQQMVLHSIFMLFCCYYLPMKCLGHYLGYIK